MRLIRFLILLVAMTLVVAAGILFTLENDVLVPLKLLVVDLPEQRLAFWMILAFVAGGLSGVLAASLALGRMRAAKAISQRRFAQLEKKLQGSGS
ncbi:MAG: lipopolysaccharide assembly protein LapA domain-containing protein [Spongiibacteraceae bacterium]